MGVIFGLLSALGYGTADFAAGLASRRSSAGAIAAVVQALGLIAALVALMLFPGHGPSFSALGWGALSGLGGALGTFALYRGLAVSRMSVVATISAVLTAVLPVVVGLALGNRLSVSAAVGILVAVPGIGLVSWQPGSGSQTGAETGAGSGHRTGLFYGMLAGLGFGLLFVCLDRAGAHAGAWPLVPGELVALAIIAPFAWKDLRSVRDWSAPVTGLALAAGVLSGVANLLFLSATGRGELAIIAVVTSLYPVATVILARFLLAERWSRRQQAGLLAAAAAIVLVASG
jgi:drug/metabolite transporter (DMT)-like permease